MSAPGLFGLPWEAWSAIAAWLTLVAGGFIATVAAGAAWAQFHGTMQFEIETDDLDGRHLITVTATNRTPYTITLARYAVRAREWALVGDPVGAEPMLGNGGFPIGRTLAPGSSAEWRFDLSSREEGMHRFTIDVKWGRNGPSGRLKTEHVDGRLDRTR